jgi:hypothetical protein
VIAVEDLACGLEISGRRDPEPVRIVPECPENKVDMVPVIVNNQDVEDIIR